MKAPRLPRYEGKDLPPSVAAYLNSLVAQIEMAVTQVPQGRPYTVTNGVPTRSLNVSTATASDVAKVVGTMLADLKAGNALG